MLRQSVCRSSGGFSDPQGGSSNSATEVAAAAELVRRRRAMSEAIEDACRLHAELVEPASPLHAAAILLMGDVSPNTGVRASCASELGYRARHATTNTAVALIQKVVELGAADGAGGEIEMASLISYADNVTSMSFIELFKLDDSSN